MNLDDYQTEAVKTAIYPTAGTGSFPAVSYAVLGLTNEAGEVAGKLKKIWRDDGGLMTHSKKSALAAELGDVLWYLATAANELGYDLSSIAEHNLEKLNSRKERGTIGGSGDNR